MRGEAGRVRGGWEGEGGREGEKEAGKGEGSMRSE